MAGTPTKAEVHTMLKSAVEALYVTQNFGNGTLLSDLADIENNAEGEYPPVESVGAAKAMRAGVAGACSPQRARALLLPVVREYGRLAESPWWNKSNVGALLEDVRRYWQGESDTIKERDHAFDSTIAADGSNTGSGAVSRLTEDMDGYKLNSWGDTKILECVLDHNSGTRKHEEVFEIRGEDAGMDELDPQGSGAVVRAPSRHAGTSPSNGSLLRNSSFQTHDGTTNADQFRSWNADSGAANLSQDTTYGYRGIPGDDTSHSIKADGDFVLSQKISVSNLALNRSVPYYFGVAYNRSQYSGAATLRIRLGTQTTTLVLAAQSGWGILALGLDQNSWFENFNEDDLDLTVELESHSSGSVLIDDAIFCPLSLFDGAWYLIRGGATRFLAATSSLPYGDKFQADDTGGVFANAKIAHAVWRAGLARAFPTTSGVATVTDP